MAITFYNPVVYDSNTTTRALTGNEEYLIRYYSHATCKISVDSTYPLDNDMFIIRNGNSTIYGKTGTFENVESNIFTFSAEDSKGNIGTYRHSATMIPYVKLTCTMVSNRPDANGKMTVQCFGNYFSGSFGVRANHLTVYWGYAKQGGSITSWETMSSSVISNTYSAIHTFTIPNFDQNADYVFGCYAEDALSTATATPTTVRSTPVFHWGENDFKFEVPIAVNGDVDIAGDLQLKTNEGDETALRFDGDWCCIKGDATDYMTIKASYINLDATYVYVKNKLLPAMEQGEWTPTLNSSAISYYTTQAGWYNKVGQTVTVGFFIKANCRSGNETVHIEIGGLPYNPAYSSAGGGMCSGAYVGANKTFQCFVAESGYKITTRVQACNNTIDTNLSTSGVGCNYRSGGGEITLSGTITYITNS